MSNSKIKVVFFDFMGTCLDWHSGVIKSLPESIPPAAKSDLALTWRHSYFDANAAQLAAKKPPQDIDLTLRQVLDSLLRKQYTEYRDLFDQDTMQKCIDAWHSMPAWPDVPQAISQLKAKGYEVIVHANGTTRLQLDLCRSSGLSFDMLFSSELTGVYKPAPESYEKMMGLVRRKPDECVLVAAHAYDTRGAKKAGMKTVYVHRWTDDINEDMDVVRGENDAFLEDMTELVDVVGRL